MINVMCVRMPSCLIFPVGWWSSWRTFLTQLPHVYLDNFQPESVDKSRPGGLVGNGETFELEFSGSGGTASNNNTDQNNHGHAPINGGGGETFSWTSTERPGRAVECLLIFNEETQVRKRERDHYRLLQDAGPSFHLLTKTLTVCLPLDIYNRTTTCSVFIFSGPKAQGLEAASVSPTQH